MKYLLKYIFTCIVTAMFLSSCERDLNILPENIISNKQVFSNESAVLAYLATLYANLPMEDFNFSAMNGFIGWSSGLTTAHCSGEALDFNFEGNLGDGTWFNWWSGGYSAIRDVNNFITNLSSANLTSDEKRAYLGEALFIRGYDYFGLVKRYGGVPIIKNVQTYSGGDISPLQVPRNTEQEVYDYIGSQLDSAAMLLPTISDRGRANKYVALALKSRVMLYAATEAKYGSVQLNGLIGIPALTANTYFLSAFNAADSVIKSGLYALYDKYPNNKVENFTDLFLDDDPTSNHEIILERDYFYPQLTHSYDMWYLPCGVMGPWGYGSQMDPTLELVEDYENVDGTPGILKVTDNNGNPIEYTNPTDIYKNKDPRCMATMIMPFSMWQTAEIDVQAGIIDDSTVDQTATVYGRKAVTTGDYNKMYNVNSHAIDPNGTQKIISINGIGGSERSITGFYIRKYLNFNMPQSQAWGRQSTQSWFDIRYAEVLLNYAEAAIELGNVSDAKWAVNQIRNRAGIAELTDSEVTRDRIRNERTVELAFENQHYWDIRRWHIADKQIKNKYFTGLYPYYDLQHHAYVFTKVPVSQPYTFLPKLYYEEIDPSQITTDPKLVQNPLY